MELSHQRTCSAQALFDSAGIARRIGAYRRAEVIFTQGDPSESVLSIQKGGVKISVRSMTGREAVVAMLGPVDVFGEGCLAGQPVCMGSGTAIMGSTILLIDRNQMARLVRQQRAVSDRFITHMLSRNTPSQWAGWSSAGASMRGCSGSGRRRAARHGAKGVA